VFVGYDFTFTPLAHVNPVGYIPVAVVVAVKRPVNNELGKVSEFTVTFAVPAVNKVSITGILEVNVAPELPDWFIVVSRDSRVTPVMLTGEPVEP
jgi:hypothetical protein